MEASKESVLRSCYTYTSYQVATAQIPELAEIIVDSNSIYLWEEYEYVVL
jgi:hypothetical protein